MALNFGTIPHRNKILSDYKSAILKTQILKFYEKNLATLTPVLRCFRLWKLSFFANSGNPVVELLQLIALGQAENTL